MMCNFSGKWSSNGEKVRLNGEEVPQKQQFRYLGSISIITQDGKAGQHDNHRIKLCCMK